MLRLTQLFNITGHPAVALPAPQAVDALPRSVQIVGRRHADRPAARDRAARVEQSPRGIRRTMRARAVLSGVFHAWERRLASVSTDRIVRPFEWGLEWVDGRGRSGDRPAAASRARGPTGWSPRATSSSRCRRATEFTLDGDWLSYPSAVETPHAENNLVRARYFPDHSPRGRKRAVIVLPQWNADSEGHVGLCRLLNRFKISALRLSLPYHDARMPPELRRADYIVSSNVGRTAQVCRQAVLDARRGVAWLASQGYESIGILGTSLGSCLAMLTAAHEPLLRAAALNHISPYFADVVWSGLSTTTCGRGSTATSTSSVCGASGCRSRPILTWTACGTSGCCSSMPATT